MISQAATRLRCQPERVFASGRALRSCDRDYVCDLTLRGDSNITAVLVGVSSTTLVVDRW